MFSRIFIIIVRIGLLIAVSVSMGIGCNGDSVDQGLGDPPWDGDKTARMVLSSESALILGYFQKRTIRLRVEDFDGVAKTGVPVSASFIGPAHNGHLEPAMKISDAKGEVSLEFTAPDKELNFEIRVSCPVVEEPIYIPVTIDPSLLGISIEIEYRGYREITSVEASLYENVVCDSEPFEKSEEPVFVQQGGGLPWNPRFEGLISDRSYAVVLHGRNKEGSIRAIACEDGLVPGDDIRTIAMTDEPLMVVGSYAVDMNVLTDGALDPVVDHLKELLEYKFVKNPAVVILDFIGAKLREADDETGARFDETRETRQLDDLLTAELGNSQEVSGEMDIIWSEVKQDLAEVQLVGVVDVDWSVQSDYSIYHRIERLLFDAGTLEYTVMVPHTGEGIATRGDNPEEIVVSRYDVDIVLGGVLYFLIVKELDRRYGVTGLGEVLEELIDCASLASFLAPELLEIISYEEISVACIDAVTNTESVFTNSIALMNSDSHITLAGSFWAVDPLTTDTVIELADGEFEFSWSATMTALGQDQSELVDYNSMGAGFSGTRIETDKKQ